ncbi:hypothetical protein A2U01_0000115 [Trifolium medium]|uniref:Uncharacterized protein n=1 Tax=Trifolium medium TaxID=97028 RepID=A0A392LWN6_9FABA|nr:hypothetical protein [Trifolium medium]
MMPTSHQPSCWYLHLELLPSSSVCTSLLHPTILRSNTRCTSTYSSLMKILPPATIGVLGSYTSVTVPSSAPGLYLFVLLKKRLLPTTLGFWDI